LVNYQKICGLIGLAAKAGKITAGTEACIEGLENKSIKLILIAKDAADRTKNIFIQKCNQLHIQIYEVLTIDELSKSIGKENKAVIGVKEKGFAEAIKNKLNGGEVIG